MNSSKSSKWLVILLLLLLLGGGAYFLFKKHFAAAPARSGKVIKGDLVQRVTIAGTVVPFRKSVVTAPYNGYVKKLFVKIGDKVKSGDPLVSVIQSLGSPEGVFPLRAPFNGIVVQSGKSEGEYVKEGDTKDFILRVDDVSRLFIVANAAEIDRVKVKLKQEGIIKAAAVLNRTYKGMITELSDAAKEREEYSRSQVAEFPIRIEILDADSQIKPGMSVVLDIITDKRKAVLMLRHEYIRREDENYFVVRKNNQRQNIKVGAQNEEAFEILEGLKEGDEIQQVDFTKIDSEG